MSNEGDGFHEQPKPASPLLAHEADQDQIRVLQPVQPAPEGCVWAPTLKSPPADLEICCRGVWTPRVWQKLPISLHPRQLLNLTSRQLDKWFFPHS